MSVIPSDSEFPVVPEIAIGPHSLGGGEPVFFLGPCVIESESFVREIARKIKEITDEAGARLVFKASYDKVTEARRVRFEECPAGKVAPCWPTSAANWVFR